MCYYVRCYALPSYFRLHMPSATEPRRNTAAPRSCVRLPVTYAHLVLRRVAHAGVPSFANALCGSL